MPNPSPAIDRILARVVEAPGPLPTPCWVTNYATCTDGYVQVSSGTRPSRHILAHRVTYEHQVGPIPDGHVLDHLCRVRHCVNPVHLEPVTNFENLMRGVHGEARRTNRCKYGHPLDDAFVTSGGYRNCRICHAAISRKYRARKAALK